MLFPAKPFPEVMVEMEVPSVLRHRCTEGSVFAKAEYEKL
jgi:hypothetical protein